MLELNLDKSKYVNFCLSNATENCIEILIIHSYKN